MERWEDWTASPVGFAPQNGPASSWNNKVPTSTSTQTKMLHYGIYLGRVRAKASQTLPQMVLAVAIFARTIVAAAIKWQDRPKHEAYEDSEIGRQPFKISVFEWLRREVPN